jgi:Flp pilus assembly protein TadD
MKRLAILALISTCLSTMAQNKKYLAAMEKNVAAVDTSRTIEQLQPLENNFERIANAEKKEWLPYYYAAYANVSMTYQSKGNTIDTYCDKADALANKADSLNPNNSEILALKAQIAAARISVNPMIRGQKYGSEAQTLREKAKTLDPTNPRPWFLEGMSLFYTPSAFGGGKDKAKVAYIKALELFAAFKPATSIHPNWGQKTTEYFLKQCEK